MKLSIIGLGLIGGSLGLDLKQSGFAKTVSGVDHSADNAKKALELQLVDQIETLEKSVKNADIVIISVPVDVLTNLLTQVLDLISPTTTVTDMGSTKDAICKAVEKHPKRSQYVASHPMAGTENSGPAAALKGLFQGKTAVICDAEKSASAHLDRVRTMYRGLGMRIIDMSSSEHDLHAAYVSHLSHISSFVLANTVLEKEKNVNTIFDLAGGGFESTVRLAKSSPEMWAPIFEQNQNHVLSALDAYMTHLQHFRDTIASKDTASCRSLMENANEIRRILNRKDEGRGPSK